MYSVSGVLPPVFLADAVAPRFVGGALTVINPNDYLMRNDAYHFFEPLGALIKTGPTHTNVCDVRVVVVERGSHG